MRVLTIDGSEGEGGGQVLRTALALSAVTQTPFRIDRIRAGRSKPGLLRQHLTGVRAVAEICGAEVDGASLGATSLSFRPGRVRAGAYRFVVGTAGSAGLVLQAALPTLLRADGPSTVVVEGGTHNPSSPPAPFLQHALFPLLSRMGPQLTIAVDRLGFYPAVVANLSRRIAQRELETVRARLALERRAGRLVEVGGPGPGNAVWIEVRTEALTEVFTAFGEKGVSAEQVAEQAADELVAWRDCGDVPVGEHLADQLLVPLALAGGGTFRTVPPSLHTRTNAEVIARFLPIRFRIAPDGGPAWRITAEPA